MITTTALANTSIPSHNYHFYFVVRTFKIYSLSTLEYEIQHYYILYIRSPEIVNLTTGSLYPLTNIFPFPPP